MKRCVRVWSSVVAIFILPALASAAWRNGVDSLWPQKAVQIDGRATEWAEWPLVDTHGVSIRAMNDASNLYLLIRGSNDQGRVLLSGTYRQNVAIWFLKPDHTTKAWGINLDFGHAHAPDLSSGPRETILLADMGIAAEMIQPQGLEVSTGSFPSGFLFQADLSSDHGRQPIFEIQIPLTMLEAKGRTVYMDLASSDVGPEVRAELQTHQAETHSPPSPDKTDSPGAGGGHGHHGHSMGGDHAEAPAVDLPKAMLVSFKIALAKQKG